MAVAPAALASLRSGNSRQRHHHIRNSQDDGTVFWACWLWPGVGVECPSGLSHTRGALWAPGMHTGPSTKSLIGCAPGEKGNEKQLPLTIGINPTIRKIALIDLLFKIPHVSDIIWYLTFFAWLPSLSMIISSFINVPANGNFSFFLWLSNISLYTHTHLLYLFICWWTFSLPPCLGCRK